MSIRSVAITSLLFLFFASLYGQQGKPFETYKKLYVKGGSQLIGNTIVGEHPTKDFNKINILNDQVDIVYVDIDDTKNTFSSSQATLTLPKNASQIVYAGLYWSGLYPAEKSKMRKGSKKMIYTNEGFRNKNIENIKIKLGDSPYQNLKGKIIFDGSTSDFFERDAPYTCYADVTSMFLEPTSEMEVTVANVRATQGFLEGGSAGGWVLYVVYEDTTQTPKYFTTFQGFEGVSKDGVTAVFDDFQAKEGTASEASILMAALEGDTKVKSDASLVFHPEKEEFIALQSASRSPRNFFTSTITSIGKTPLKRKPASKNTLGLDIAKVKLPKGIMTPQTTEVVTQWRTKADRFYLFFTAFETEITESQFNEKSNVVAVEPKKVEIIEDETKNNTPANPVIAAPMPVVEFIEPEEVVMNKEEPLQIKIDKVNNRPTVNAKGMIKGYYLVTNVFSKHNNAIEWKNYLNKEGFNARIFKGGSKNYEYVYIESSKNLEEIIERKEILNQFSYLTKIWVARVNF